MKEKSLYRIIILMSVLFYPVVTMASLRPAYSVIKADHKVMISSDSLNVNDLGVADLTPGKLDVQIGILRDKNSVSVKTVTHPKVFHLYSPNNNTGNDISEPVPHEMIIIFHCSNLFTGVRLI